MKFKRTILTFALLAMFSIFVSGFVSALTLSAPSNALSETSKEAKLNLIPDNITSSQTITLSLSNNGIISDGANSVELSLTPTQAIIPASTTTLQQVTVSVKNTIGDLKFGAHTATLTAHSSVANISDATQTITFQKSFCSKGATNKDLEITSVDIENTGDEDDEWKPLDEIEVEIEVENTGDEDIDDIIVEFGLFDSEGRNQANDLDFENVDEEEIDLGNLNDGDEETVTFSFRVPPDFEEGSYRLAIKAFSDDLGEDVECVDTSDDLSNNFFESIRVDREDNEGKFIAFDNIEITPDQVTCGDSVTVRADVFNVGDEDQDQIRVNLVSSELGIRLEKEIREDLDEGDKTEVSFIFTVPQGLKDKLYGLEFDANYDYRNGNYRESSDETTKTGLRVLDVECVEGEEPTPTGRIAVIAAALDSDVKAGEELLIKATITGLVSGEADYLIGARGYESWADLKSISEPLLSLKNQESREVTLRFDVNEDASEEQSFTLEVRTGSEIESREIEVNIEGEEEPTTVPEFNLGGNSLIWVIGIINVILIILIIVVAARISRR